MCQTEMQDSVCMSSYLIADHSKNNYCTTHKLLSQNGILASLNCVANVQLTTNVQLGCAANIK